MSGLNQALASLSRLLLRLLLVAAALVLVLSLLAAMAVLALAWTLRAGWARLTGRPVTPWVRRFDLGQQFGDVLRRGQAGPGGAGRHAPADVTDVEVREIIDVGDVRDSNPRLPPR
ncbi:hypothetical protein [Curvibacter lanceolatus]|uniref:hypothetical protein n=1 Tax=Curvibacter lanceolatus TaxID=86182 RepID=UPI00036F2B1B|nr:hypothetical protein [Curvibacter lanceolatus]